MPSHATSPGATRWGVVAAAVGAAAALAALTVLAVRSRRPSHAPDESPAQTLARLPDETRIVAALDVRRLRASPAWRRLSALTPVRPEDRRLLVDFAARTGFDPLLHLHRVVAAFPEDARRDGDFAVVLEGEAMDEARLVEHARARLGPALHRRAVGGRILWSMAGLDGVSGFLLDRSALVLAGGAWSQAMIARWPAPRPSAHPGQRDLATLLDLLRPHAALWFAAVVPGDARAALAAKFAAPPPERLAASLDLAHGLRADAFVDLGTGEAARRAAARGRELLAGARASPVVRWLALDAVVSSVGVEARGSMLVVAVDIDQPRLDDLLGRLEAAWPMLRAGGGGAPDAGHGVDGL